VTCSAAESRRVVIRWNTSRLNMKLNNCKAHSLRPHAASVDLGEHPVVHDSQILHQHLLPAMEKPHSSAGDPCVLTREVKGESITIPVGQFVIGIARGQTKNQMILFNVDLANATLTDHGPTSTMGTSTVSLRLGAA